LLNDDTGDSNEMGVKQINVNVHENIPKLRARCPVERSEILHGREQEALPMARYSYWAAHR